MKRIDRIAYGVSAALLASGLVHVAILVATGGSWSGPLSLRKPATFGLSFGITLFTLAWVSRFVALRSRTRATLLAAFTAACVLETALVSIQAWRGVPSHFNMETAFDTTVAQLLAAGGAVLVAVILVMTTASFRANPSAAPSMRFAVSVGFVTLAASMFVGSAMIARGVALVVTGHAQDAYATGGVFKPAHAVLMHGVLVLPAIAWALSFVDWKEQRRVRAVAIASAAYAVAAVFVVAADIAGVV